MAQNNVTALLSKLSADEMAELLTQVTQKKVSASKRDLLKKQYGEDLVPAVTRMIEGEEYTESDKSDWAGYKVYSIPVEVEGHTFTVSVTVTDTARKVEREEARKVEEAKALLGLDDE